MFLGFSWDLLKACVCSYCLFEKMKLLSKNKEQIGLLRMNYLYLVVFSRTCSDSFCLFLVFLYFNVFLGLFVILSFVFLGIFS